MQIARSNHGFTVKDYRTWDDDGRWELIDGIAYSTIEPDCTTGHDLLVSAIRLSIRNSLEDAPCSMFSFPNDLYFANGDDADTAVRPDLAIVFDQGKVREGGIVGAPDWIIEVISPSSETLDLFDKMRLYQREGVMEYWVIIPQERRILRHVLVDGHYQAESFSEGTMDSVILKEFTLNVEDFFELLGKKPVEKTPVPVKNIADKIDIEIAIEDLSDTNGECSSWLHIKRGKMWVSLYAYGDAAMDGDETEVWYNFEEGSEEIFLESLGLLGESKGKIQEELQNRFSQRPSTGAFNGDALARFFQYTDELGLKYEIGHYT